MSRKKIEVEPEFYSTTVIAKKLSVSTDTVRREIKSGRLKARVLPGGDFLILASSYEEWKARYLKGVAC